jgi:hypothetical protein
MSFYQGRQHMRKCETSVRTRLTKYQNKKIRSRSFLLTMKVLKKYLYD